MTDPLGVLSTFERGAGLPGRFWSLPKLEKIGLGRISRLPVSIRVVLESLVRNLDGVRVHEKDVRALCAWQPRAERSDEIPFVVSRVLAQDFTGVPLIVDLAAMRAAMARDGRPAARVEPLVPVDLVVDHSVQVDAWGSADALAKNLELEFARNRERYAFLKWGTQAFKRLRIVPPGIGICHQVNLEFLASVATERDGAWFFDTRHRHRLPHHHGERHRGGGLGRGRHRGRGGHAGAADLLPDPRRGGRERPRPAAGGRHRHRPVLTVTELLRRTGWSASSSSSTARARPASPPPSGPPSPTWRPSTARPWASSRRTSRPCGTWSPPDAARSRWTACGAYLEAQGAFGVPRQGEARLLRGGGAGPVDRRAVGGGPEAAAGPASRSPQVKERFTELFSSGRDRLRQAFGRALGASRGRRRGPRPRRRGDRRHHLLHQHLQPGGHAGGRASWRGRPASAACARPPHVKTSLAPGSRVVPTTSRRPGCSPHLDALGFQVVGYGCTTCIGNSGPIDARLEAVIGANDLVAASVLSGNRNFEARVHVT